MGRMRWSWVAVSALLSVTVAGAVALRRELRRANRAPQEPTPAHRAHAGHVPADIPGFDDRGPYWAFTPSSVRAQAVIFHGTSTSRAQTLRLVRLLTEMGVECCVPLTSTSHDTPEGSEAPADYGSAAVEVEGAVSGFWRHDLPHLACGYSMGASTAVRFAETHAVCGLVLVSPALDWPRIIGARLERMMGIPEPIGDRIITVVNGVGPQLFRGDEVVRLRGLVVSGSRVWISHGLRDVTVPVGHSRALESWPGVTLEIFDSTHTLEWESDAKRFTQSLGEWVESVGHWCHEVET